MENLLARAGLAIAFVGVIVLALADAWLTRSILVYLDAVESNVGKLVDAVRAGGTQLAVTGIDLQRDRRQNSARALKLFGWFILTMGIALQLAARYVMTVPL